STFVHVGPGDVTAGMARKTLPGAQVLVVSSLDDIAVAVESIGTMGGAAMTLTAEITGWGTCMPPNVPSNHDLEQIVDTSDEWITTRTGIKERRISHVEASELAAVACHRALAAAGKTPEDVDLLLVATCSGDSIIPSTASVVQ